MINTWIQFENDLCIGCRKSKYGKITDQVNKDTLTMIISCDCDTAVFADEWKKVGPQDLIVVLDPNGVENMLRMLGEWMGAKR